MPPPPEDADIRTMPYLDFSSVECLLYAFHRLARQCPDFLTHDPIVLKDFRARLMYFSRGVQGCSKAINNFDVKDKTLSMEDKKKMEMSPKLFSNINSLIKDLFFTPPMYKCNVVLSFKKEEGATKVCLIFLPLPEFREKSRNCKNWIEFWNSDFKVEEFKNNVQEVAIKILTSLLRPCKFFFSENYWKFTNSCNAKTSCAHYLRE